MEQYANSQIYAARATAITFYSPIYLPLSMYSNQPEHKEKALKVPDRQVEQFF